ncbi:NACHT domain-containing protein [Streptomyces sp. NPDC059070]|uniref:NACHT domain-containing protein n=1 Tax=Streptomyces sp. NPDC059070 TaxID=3346713 RepID=UPI00368BE491
MGVSRTRRVTVVYVALQTATAVVALWLTKQFQVARMAATAVALAPTVPGAYLAWAAYREDRAEAAADVDAKARVLAAAVAAAETRQRAQLIGPGAHRIDVAFTHRREPANNAAGARPDGRLTDVVAYYQRLRPARLVITGAPGAGKTLLAIELVLGLLTRPDRAPDEPVPVRLSLASWDTERPLHQWLAQQVHEQFSGRLSLADARQLVDSHRVLPVLDGLDEMDTSTTPAARRRAARALEQLSAYQDPTGNAPLVLTCRTPQYAELAALDVRMREAARIELDPLTPAQATAYLTARTTSPARWATVVDALTTAPGGTLARALSTPWRLNLAATAYEERDRATLAHLRHPDQLLTLASPSAVRDHLLALYLPAAASLHRTRPGRYSGDQTHRWLAALAAHLAANTPAGGTDIVLLQLWPMAGRLRVRITDAVLAVLLALACTAPLLAQADSSSPAGLLAGAAVALYWLAAIWNAGRPTVPDRLHTFRLHRLRNSDEVSEETAFKVVRTLVATLPIGLTIALVGVLAGRPTNGLADGWACLIAVGLVLGLLGAATLGLAKGLTTPVGDAPLTDPRHPVRADLTVGLVAGPTLGLAYALVCAVSIILGTVYGTTLTAGTVTGHPAGIHTLGAGLDALATALGSAFTTGLTAGLTDSRAFLLVGWLASGLAMGLAAGLYLIAGAGRRYLVFLLCSQGRLPLRLGSFFHWAYEGGLLRISGAAYQFRHRELQDWLAGHPTP